MIEILGLSFKYIKMRKQLTYILGAGASFESIPLVKSFPTRFQKFNDYLIQVHSDAGFGEGICNLYRDVHKKSKELYEAFKSHQSFDTYFKKLFHTKSASEIFLAKKNSQSLFYLGTSIKTNYKAYI
jgi:hypothetical protein